MIDSFDSPIVTAIGIYLILVSIFWFVKPGIAFNQDGSVRPFGSSNGNMTIFPVWYFMIIFAIVSYLYVVKTRI
jgi:quinol-cytochrome oxidoreductase complex cytochrome b subunit